MLAVTRTEGRWGAGGEERAGCSESGAAPARAERAALLLLTTEVARSLSTDLLECGSATAASAAQLNRDEWPLLCD